MQFIWLPAIICLCFVEKLCCLLEIKGQMERGGMSVITFILHFVIRFCCYIIQISESIVVFWLTAKGISRFSLLFVVSWLKRLSKVVVQEEFYILHTKEANDKQDIQNIFVTKQASQLVSQLLILKLFCLILLYF